MRRPKDVVSAMIKRLAHRNANVQLYTLEVSRTSPVDYLRLISDQLANSLSQNCGVKVHRELASRSFTDALLRLAGDRVRTRTQDILLNLIGAEHTSAGQGQNTREDGGMGGDVFERSRSWSYGTGIYEVENSK